ncbi:spore germination protein [Alicyclobacillus acidocaldarius]|uniref:GerA spore germination protein n=1 Tax=Alicyclobacillus acidocaldarius subsp. acidocaldarius (strain ATCC 27009 / DSM 446 / BCRC 14685 / JCM 5260 / KCTC 1825 / NBRC 15652 / NCIMB 11725 / NRRL B-14509 / 104-IA) TaxID=521098 RepID=C8WWV2_ALIAD|nr:spore germination protein [Alicyclobacillus acidocaldarius]ACV58574.1 GerA spore germination protein [Alicyclobacillus acidocaldarius subsp. acidocaldarius DSM 446]
MRQSAEPLVSQPISRTLEHNVNYINQLLGIGTTWDIMAKPFRYGRLNMMSYVTNGFFLTMNVVLVLDSFHRNVEAFEREHEGQTYDIEELVFYLNTHIDFVQVQVINQMSDAVRFILSGPLVTFIDGYDKVLVVDTRVYPMRGIEPPMIERVVRGNHDGFTETMLMNTTLIRRRLRDPRLRNELYQVGDRGQTDVSLMYLKDVADEETVSAIRELLRSVKTGGMMMGEQQLVDLIGKVKWNPYPIVRYTERPDVAATALIEGHVVIVVDATAEVIIAPTTFFQHIQHPQEYHSFPLVGTYLRWIIVISVFMSVFLPGIFMLANQHPGLLPSWAKFFMASRNDPLPLWAQLLVAEFALDVLRLAVLNVPVTLSNAIGIVSALLFGQFATQIQLLQPEVLVYMGFVMLAQYATSSFELASANQMARIWIMLWTAALNWGGFLLSTASWFLLLLTTKSFGKPYLWPLIPFTWRDGMRDVLIRWPSSDLGGVPTILRNRRRAR